MPSCPRRRSTRRRLTTPPSGPVTMPELPEVETIRRELERDIAGLRIKDVEVTDLRSIRRHGKKAPFVKALDGAKVTHVNRRGKYLVLSLDTGSVLVIHLGMSGQLRRNAAKDAMRAAHPGGAHLHPEGPAPLHRPPQVRGDVRGRGRRGRRRGPRAGPPRLRPRRAGRVLDPLRPGPGQPQREAEAPADGPEVHRRHRQHLRRRDPLRGRPALRPPVGLAVHPGDPPALPVPGRDPARRHQVPGLDPRPTASTSTSRASRASTRSTTRSTTARARPAAAAARSSSGSRPTAAAPSTASSARSDAAARRSGVRESGGGALANVRSIDVRWGGTCS